MQFLPTLHDMKSFTHLDTWTMNAACLCVLHEGNYADEITGRLITELASCLI
jgi:hypothetical protein